MKIRAPLWRGRETASTVFFETREGSVLLRLPKSMVPDDVDYISFNGLIDSTGAVGDFMRFLLASVVADPDGKLSAVMLWAAWAEWNGTEPNQDEQIGGIAFGDVHEYFRDCFNAGDTVRRRLDGRAQRVWLGYRLADDESVLESED